MTMNAPRFELDMNAVANSFQVALDMFVCAFGSVIRLDDIRYVTGYY